MVSNASEKNDRTNLKNSQKLITKLPFFACYNVF